MSGSREAAELEDAVEERTDCSVNMYCRGNIREKTIPMKCCRTGRERIEVSLMQGGVGGDVLCTRRQQKKAVRSRNTTRTAIVLG